MIQPGPRTIHNLSRCPVCGQAVIGHPTCRDCGISVGPLHTERMLYGGLCSSCARWRVKRQAKKARAG